MAERMDIDQVRLLLSLQPGERIRVMLDVQELAKGLIMGRPRRLHPDLSPNELGLKFIEVTVQRPTLAAAAFHPVALL